MTKEEHIAYWLKSAEKDWETLEHLLKAKRYVHTLFFGHLYVEKISKAVWISRNTENTPPKSHNILSILQRANVVLTEDQQTFLLKLHPYQIEGRYSEDIDTLYEITDADLTNEYIETIKIVVQCLHKLLQSNK